VFAKALFGFLMLPCCLAAAEGTFITQDALREMLLASPLHCHSRA
jgi:hypothetical protein